MVALEHEGAGGFFVAFGFPDGGAGGAGEGDVLVDEAAVVAYLDEPRGSGLAAGSVEAGRGEGDVEALPFTGGEAGVDAG